MSQYKNGNYYKEIYLTNRIKNPFITNIMSLELSTKWMANYYKVVKKLFPELDEYKNKTVMEIGCSWGGFVKQLFNNNFKNIIYADMDSIVDKTLAPELKILDLLDIKEEQVSAYKSDLIFAFEVLEHIDDNELAIENLKRILKDNGVFIFSVPFPSKKTLRDKYHINVQFPNFYTNLFHRKGFELLDYQEVSFIPIIWRFGLPAYFKFKTDNNYFLTEVFFAFKKL
jgi:2-polyprenyl-3-methyl-5-hydroxy-6-metoxy-1,4-benzoquinol methylase